MEDYPANATGVRGPLLDRGGMSRVPLPLAVAGGLPMPTLRRWQDEVAGCHLVPVYGLRLPGLGDGWHGVPGHAEASGGLVSGDVVCDQPKERRQRVGPAAGPWTGQLSDGLVVAA